MIPEDAIWILELIRNRDARTEAEKDAVNAAIEALKAQLFSEGATSDMIDRQAALKALRKCQTYLYDARDPELKIELSSAEAAINNLPTIQPVATDTNVGSCSEIPNSWDCISRQAAIDAIDKALSRTFIEPCGEMILKDLPSAQPEPQWIPVSERLPESGTYCLFTVFEHDSELEATTIETVYGCFNDYGERRYWSWEDEFGNCCIKGEEQLDGDHDEIIEKVLAWMPLPEPYKPNNK